MAFTGNWAEIVPDLFVWEGAVATGVLRCGDAALLIDCCDTLTPERLAEIGVQQVAMILCTQHRRPNVAGAYPFVARGAALVVPEAERCLFEDVERYWAAWQTRWHIYHHQPGPYVLPRSMPVTRTVREGATLTWGGFAIQVLDTPGATDGSVSYRVQGSDCVVCFCGDALYGPGQVWDLASLQKGSARITDYHGFIGNRRKLVPSLRKLGACGADFLVPSHGPRIPNPADATSLTVARLEALWRNYTAISCLNHYFPGLLDEEIPDPAPDAAAPARMSPVATREPPAWVRRVAYTSFAVLSASGAALLIDCGHDTVVDALLKWIQEKTITLVEGCWVTHYHDDHVDALARAVSAFGCPIITDQHMAEIVAHPTRFFLPCVSPSGVPVARITREGESWPWHEFRLTAYHFPGQTLYHSGLLVEGRGSKVFFAGDSGSPTGIDDHCCPNRNLLGPGVGFRRCFEIWRATRPDYILNQHQPRAFAFTDAELDAMDQNLAARERLLAELLPWAHPNFGTDEGWVRAYPYEQEVGAGATLSCDLQFTNHGPEAVEVEVEPVLPAGWSWDRVRSTAQLHVPARTDGVTGAYTPRPDGFARLWFAVPDEAPPGRYALPFRVTWGDRYLGPFRHALVVVR